MINRMIATLLLLHTVTCCLVCAQSPQRHALLVGCSEYKNLGEQYQLQGPVNDVQLMRQLLIDRFEFDPARDDLVILAASEDAAHQPTREHIEREFVRLGKTVQANEPVVILLAGHGSQQPNNDPDNPNDQEEDGLDELFLPCDVGKWNGATGTVENAIVDDDFRTWLAAISARQASVWLIMDACHSGSGVRGSEDEVSRQIPPGSLVPESALAAAESAAKAIPATNQAAESFFDGPGELVAIYAAQPHETTPEKKLPSEAEPSARKYYGLLTFTIADILGRTARKLTYNELVQAVQTRYITAGRRAPTPLIEGSHRDNLVLGRESYPERSRILLQRAAGSAGMSISAGALGGLTRGCVLAVHPPVGSASPDPDQLLGHVVVTQVDMTSSRVERCDEKGELSPSTDQLPERASCTIFFQQIERFRPRLVIDPHDSEGDSLADGIRTKLQTQLVALASDAIEVVSNLSEADWLLRLDDRELQLIPAAGIAQEDRDGFLENIASFNLDGDWAKELVEHLGRIMRAQNLLRLSDLGSEKSRGEELGVQLRVLDASGQPINWQSAGRTLTDCDRITVEIKNTGKQSADVTLLYVDSAFGIGCLYPGIGELNRLAAGEQQAIPLTVTATTTGLENLVSIVVRGEGQPKDYSFLEQPGLQNSRLRGGAEDPFDQLCQTAIYGVGNCRGMGRSQAKEYEINVLTWRVKPLVPAGDKSQQK